MGETSDRVGIAAMAVVLLRVVLGGLDKVLSGMTLNVLRASWVGLSVVFLLLAIAMAIGTPDLIGSLLEP